MNQSRICTLMYHDVYGTSNTESGFNIDSNFQYKIQTAVFEDQIAAIAKYIEDHAVDENYVRLSFDDGGVSSFNIIMPILEKYGFKGYFFVAIKYIGKDGFLTEPMIKAMADRGHFIGAHSHRQRMNDLSYEDLLSDWIVCVSTISRITGNPCRIASLPNGFSSENIIKVLKNVGIKLLYTSQPSEDLIVNGDLEIRGRYGIGNTMDICDVLAITFDESRKWKLRQKKAVLNIAKRLLGSYYIKIREYLFKYK